MGATISDAAYFTIKNMFESNYLRATKGDVITLRNEFKKMIQSNSINNIGC